MMGVTLGNFAELNFSLLTPFVLDDWKFTKPQIAMAMSLLGAVDISIRFFVPFIAGKVFIIFQFQQNCRQTRMFLHYITFLSFSISIFYQAKLDGKIRHSF